MNGRVNKKVTALGQSTIKGQLIINNYQYIYILSLMGEVEYVHQNVMF